MPGERVVVSDTSPVLNLALIDRLDLLRTQFSTIILPEQVWDELVEGDEGVESIRALHDEGVLEIDAVDDSPLFAEFRRHLDVGEAATLAYAIQNSADLVLLDEREARQTARRHDIAITGVVGILLRGAEVGRCRSGQNSTVSETPGSGFRTPCTSASSNERTKADPGRRTCGKGPGSITGARWTAAVMRGVSAPVVVPLRY